MSLSTRLHGNKCTAVGIDSTTVSSSKGRVSLVVRLDWYKCASVWIDIAAVSASQVCVRCLVEIRETQRLRSTLYGTIRVWPVCYWKEWALGASIICSEKG
jgi:hypothetical protein